MPRPRKTRQDRRICFVGVRLRTDQRRKVRRHARAAGVSVSTYLSRFIDGEPLVQQHAEPPLDLAPLPLLAQWQRVGNNVNQLTRAENRGRDPAADAVVGAMHALLKVMLEDQFARRYALRFGSTAIEACRQP